MVKSNTNMFYVLVFASEIIADEIRAQYPKFQAVNIFTGEDLTYRERKRCDTLMQIMLKYWGR